tara:strand:- start:366 stop:884 length:519 start_codon:yes stop_codon:yes gene_type:complete
MTKLRKSKLDVVEPSYVLKGNEYFVLSRESNRKNQKDREIYRKGVAAMKADGFVVRKKFKTFAEAREYAKKANQKYDAKFGVTVGDDISWVFSSMPVLDKAFTPKKTKRKYDPYYGKAKRLAKKLGIEIIIDDLGDNRAYWIEYEGWDDEKFCLGWDEVYDKLREIERELSV